MADGFQMGTDGVFIKGELRASARLIVQDDYQKVQTAEIIKKECAEAGIEILIEKYPVGTFYQDYVRPRNFDIVLVSQNMGADSDLYAFWYSTNASDPGLNFSGYSDRKLDKFIEQARATLDPNVRSEKYAAVATIISDETAAVFLVWPDNVFGLSKEVKGFLSGRFTEPKDHFWNITDWYILDKIAK
jgi:peptide/nickel transport system substrate-binding protein